MQALAASAVTQALAVALLAGRQIDRCEWRPPFPIGDVVDALAWDAFPRVIPPSTIPVAG